MSKNVWLTRPSKRKSETILEALHHALAQSVAVPPEIACAFAGYLCEYRVQRYPIQVDVLWGGAVRGNHRYSRSKHGQNHLLTTVRHTEWIAAAWAPLVGLDPSTPPEIVHDALHDGGFQAQQAILAVLINHPAYKGSDHTGEGN